MSLCETVSISTAQGTLVAHFYMQIQIVNMH